MTGGWGKTYAAFIIGAATIGTANQTADAQTASALPSSTTTATNSATTTAQTPAQTAQTALQAQQAITAQGAQPVQPSTAPPPAFAIEGNILTQLEIDDNGGLRTNSPGSDMEWFTRFDIGIRSETPTDLFSFTIGAQLQFEDLAVDNEENGLEDPFARLRYTRNGADSQLSFSGDFRTDDILDSIFVDTDGDLIDDTLFESSGSVSNLSYGARYSFGIQAPFGMDFGINRREVDYSNTISPDLNDETTDRFDVTARFRINPVLTARAFVNLEQYEAEDAARTDRETTDIGVGVNYEIARDLRFDGQISSTDVEESLTFGGVRSTTDNDGFSAQMSLVRDLPNGSIGFTYTRDQFTNTVRNDYSLDRTLTLPGGDLSFGVGFSTSDTGDTVIIGSLDYSNQLANGLLTANLSRTAVVNNDNEEVTRTFAGLGYVYNLNQLSAVDFGLNLARVDDSGVGVSAESTRADFSVGYRYQVTRDWDWRISYVGRYQKDNVGDTARSNAIVTSFGRSFSIRP